MIVGSFPMVINTIHTFLVTEGTAPEGWPSFITLATLGTAIIILVMSALTIAIYVSFHNSDKGRMLRKVSILALIGTFLFDAILHIVAFFAFADTWMNTKSCFNSDCSIDYTVFNYPGSYTQFYSGWPFSGILDNDLIIALFSTFVVAIAVAGAYLFTRRSYQRRRGRVIRKTLIVALISAIFIDLIIGTVKYLLGLQAPQRIVFETQLILYLVLALVIGLAVWGIFEYRLLLRNKAQEKTFEEKMNELNKRLTEASKETDRALDDMVEAIEKRKSDKSTLDKDVEILVQKKKQEEEDIIAIKGLTPQAGKWVIRKMGEESKKSRGENFRDGLVLIGVGFVLTELGHQIFHFFHWFGF